MEKCLYNWFLNQREKKKILTGPVLKAKAKSIFSEVYPDKDENAFTASNGWFFKFKTRHGLRFLKIGGEILSSDVGAVIYISTQISCKSRGNGFIGNTNLQC